jgi:hypothetical protein
MQTGGTGEAPARPEVRLRPGPDVWSERAELHMNRVNRDAYSPWQMGVSYNVTFLAGRSLRISCNTHIACDADVCTVAEQRCAVQVTHQVSAA